MGDCYLHKKRRACLSFNASLEYRCKKEKNELARHSFEGHSNDKGKLNIEQQKMQQKKECTSENEDSHCKKEVQTRGKIEAASYTSTPKKNKIKRSRGDSEESVLESKEELISTKASKTGERCSFFVAPINRLQQEENLNKAEDVPKSFELIENIVKDKKKRKKDAILDNSYNSSDLSGVESISTKVAKQKNKKRFNDEDSFTSDVYDSQSDNLDSSRIKKKKKKHQKGKPTNASWLSANYSIVDQGNDNDVQSDHMQNSKEKKKSKNKNEQSFEENGLLNTCSVGPENLDIVNDDWVQSDMNKKKRKDKNEQLIGENGVSSSSDTKKLDIVVEHKRKKRIKHEQKNKEKKENETQHMSRSDSRNEGSSDDQIDGFHKHKNIKIKNSDSTCSSEVLSSSEEKKHKKKKNKLKPFDFLQLDISENHNGASDEHVNGELSDKAEKNKNEENISDSENQSKRVIHSKKEIKTKKKKGVELKLLLAEHEYKSEEKRVNMKRKHSVLLDKSGEQTEVEIEEKDKPFESTDLSITELLEDLKDKTRPDDDEIEKLRNLEILVPWNVPLLHLIERRVAGRPTLDDRKSIEALGVKVKTGQFSKREDDQIKYNWKKFCKMHNLSKDPKPFLHFATPERKVIIPTAGRISFVRFLAHGLENRLLCSVYNRFKRLFLGKIVNSGRFTEKEDEIIINFLNESASSTPYSDLAKLLNRSKLSIERRCKNLADKVKGYGDTIKWNRELVEEFMKYFVDVTRVKDVEELKDREITSEEWKEVSDRLDIPVKKLRHAWQYTLHARVFVKEPILTKDIRTKLMKTLINREESDWKTVNWNKIAKEFDGFNGMRLNRLARDFVRYYVPLNLQNDLKASLNYIKNTPATLNNTKTRKVRRLRILDRRPTECR